MAWGPAGHGLEAPSAASLCSKSVVCSQMRCVSENHEKCLPSLFFSPPSSPLPSLPYPLLFLPSLFLSLPLFPFLFGSRGSACIFHNLALTLAVSGLALKII